MGTWSVAPRLRSPGRGEAARSRQVSADYFPRCAQKCEACARVVTPGIARNGGKSVESRGGYFDCSVYSQAAKRTSWMNRSHDIDERTISDAYERFRGAIREYEVTMKTKKIGGSLQRRSRWRTN